MRRTAVLGFAFTATLTVLTAGCSDSGGSSTPTTSSSTTSTTAVDARTDADNEEQAVIDAYLAAIDAFYLAANPPDPNHPELVATHTGELLSEVQSSLRELADRGRALRRGALSTADPAVIRLDGDTALIEDCATDADVQFDITTGEIIDDAVVFGRFTAQLVHQENQWIITAIDFEELEEPCTTGASI